VASEILLETKFVTLIRDLQCGRNFAIILVAIAV